LSLGENIVQLLLRHFISLTAALAVAVSTPVFAQGVTTRLIGTVRDNQGGVLPGVTITATSPSLIGTQSAVSESNGSYQFPTLPAGTYRVVFELSGFQTVARDAIVLASGQTLTIDIDLPIGGLTETVQVTTTSPVLDRQSTTIGNVLDTAELTTIPSSTDLWAALTQAPGIRAKGFDVGGSHKIQSTGYDAFGVSGQVRVLTEGVDQTEGNGGAGFYQDFYANSEISVSAAGQDVTTNTPGALVQVTVKSGGNDFKGLFNQSYEGRDFVGNNIDDETAARGFTGQPNLSYTETHGDVGGPIWRDKLWFFVSRNHFRIDKAQSGVPESVATDLGIVDDITTKETWKPSANNTVIAYYQHQHKQQPKRGLSITTGPGSTLAQSSYAWMGNVRWQRVWSNRLFSEVNGGQWGYNFPLLPTTDYKVSPPRTDQITGVNSGAGAGPSTSNPRKPQFFASTSYYLPTNRAGSHDLKAGAEWLDDGGSSGATGKSGAIQYLDANGQTNQVRLTDVGTPETFGDTWLPSTDGNRRLAAYLQDRWAITNRITVTAGVRYDRQEPYYEESKRAPVLSDVFVASITTGRDLLVRNTVAPRVGIAIDPTGSGLSSVKAFYGRYYHNFASQFTGVNPGGTNTKTYGFNDLNGNRLYDGVGELGALVASSGGATTTFDPDLKTPHTDEFNASYQRQFWGQSAVRIAWVRKQTRNAVGTFNAAWIGQFTQPVSRTVSLQDVVSGVTGSETFVVFDIPASLRGVVANVIRNVPESANGGAANYDTIELAFNKRFGSKVFVDASVDTTRSDDLRNANGVSNSPLTQADPISSTYFENVYPSVGNRQSTSVWSARVSGRYELPLAINVAANVRVQSGWNYARVISVSLPNAGTQRFWYEDLDNNRAEAVPLVSTRVDRTWRIWRTDVTGMIDVFNVFNANPVTNFNLSNGPTFGQINGALDPRTAQIGLRIEF
jgi:Carboxypeptidase regulatory-like domain/TonB dependent receptor